MTKKKKRTGLVAGIFVGLKILEAIAILVIVFGFYYFGKFICSIREGLYCFGSSSFSVWFTGLFVFAIGGLVLFLVGLIIISIIQANWDWAKKISKSI